MRNEFGMKKTDEMFAVYKMSNLAFLYGTMISLDCQKEEKAKKTMEFIKLCQDFMLEKSEIKFLEIYNKYSEYSSDFSVWCHERENNIEFEFNNFQSIINDMYENEKDEVIDISKFMNMKNVTTVKKDEQV